METKSTGTTAHRPAAALYVLLAAFLAYQSSQLDSVWRYPLGVVAIILVVLAVRALRNASTGPRRDQ